jgi:hypothetical protein
MRNSKLFLAFVTSKDDDEEFMMPAYYRFFFPLLQLTHQIWRDNRAVNLERETEREYEFGATLRLGFRL